MLIRLSAAIIAMLVLYFSLWPVVIEPVAWKAPEAPSYQGSFSVNDSLKSFDSLTMGDQTGPEGVVVDSDGRVYATTDQGWVVRWQPDQMAGEKWVKLPGRGLGICLGDDNDFWVADAFEGVFHISAGGELTKKLTEVEGQALLYANDLVMAPSGKIYLTDSTTRFSAKAYGSTYKASLVDIMEHQKTGRVIEFDPATNIATVIMSGLSFANGITVDPAGRFLLINETSEYRVWKYWLAGEKQGQSEVIVDNLPGFPDNILAGKDGRFWLGFTSPRIALLDSLAAKPFLRKVVQRLPTFVRPAAQYYGHILAISEDGDILANLQDPAATYPLTTGASETSDYLYVSSLVAPVLARVRRDDVGL
ncbi:MAG: SMP-30/gluconolactonase/LRE family protein [Cellvibrionaceae bacterium]